MKKMILIAKLLLLLSIPVLFLFCTDINTANFTNALKKPQRTVEDVLAEYSEAASARLHPHFEKAGMAFPPKAIKLLALKEEKILELWAKDKGEFKFIRSYPIAKLSGKAGPKLKEGDRQVPEGSYKITWLHPNSSYHLSMKLNYPNAFDLLHAKEEGRSEPGSDIFIHGKAVSIGCLAMGDTVIEELFVLAAKTGIENMEVLIAPHDPRKRLLAYNKKHQAAWVEELYRMLNEKFSQLRKSK